MDVPQKKPKVLVTDDDMVQRLIFRTTLEADGYDVREAENGADALEKLSQERISGFCSQTWPCRKWTDII